MTSPAIGSTKLEMKKGERFSLHHIAHDQIFVGRRKSTQHPIYREVICYLVVPLSHMASMHPMHLPSDFLSIFSLPFFRRESGHLYFSILACAMSIAL